MCFKMKGSHQKNQMLSSNAPDRGKNNKQKSHIFDGCTIYCIANYEDSVDLQMLLHRKLLQSMKYFSIYLIIGSFFPSAMMMHFTTNFTCKSLMINPLFQNLFLSFQFIPWISIDISLVPSILYQISPFNLYGDKHGAVKN